MKIIDLLNKMANGEEVPNFIVDEVEYYMGANGYLRECMDDDTQWYIDKSWLNTEVEILEEKKIPEKLEILSASDILDILGIKQTKHQQKAMQNLIIYLQKQSKKINEIIDYLESKGE